jgi:hypothetical protein
MAGENAQVRTSFEVSEGLPGSDFTFIPFATESLDMQYTAKPDPNIDPSGNEGDQEILEAHGTGSLSGAFSSETQLKFRAHMHEYNETTEVVAGVQLWELRDLDEVNDTPVAYYKDSMNFGIWRDERDNPTEYSIYGAKASRMELSVSRGEFATMTHDWLFTRDTYSRKPFEQAVNAAWTGDIHVRGHRAAGDENGDYYKLKVPVGGGGAVGVATFVWGKGVGAYGTTEYTTAAIMDVMNANDTLAGSEKIPYQIMLDPGGVFTDGDEFRIYPNALKAVASYSTRPRLHGAAALIEIGGVSGTFPIEEFTIQHFVPREAKGGIGSIFDQNIGKPAQAQRAVEFSFARTYIDLRYKQALLQGAAISMYLKLSGRQIGATVHNDFAEYEAAALRVTGAGSTVQNPGDNPETVTLRGSGLIERYQNTITTITPP